MTIVRYLLAGALLGLVLGVAWIASIVAWSLLFSRRRVYYVAPCR